MPNITVTVSQDIYNDARIYAAQRRTSVSAIVQFCLQNLTNLTFKSEAALQMLRNRQSQASAARAREQASRPARMAAFQAVTKAAQSAQNRE